MVTVEFVRDPRPYGSEIRRLLAEANDEFVPPLASREGTTQTAGLDEQRNDALEDYHEQCMDQSFVLAHADDDVYGFLSFRQDYATEALGDYIPSNYVSTIIVDEARRREGYARRMYETLLTDLPPSARAPYVTTRTWSTNDGHLTLLEELGFECLARLEDDRGEGIDTVYYGIAADEFDP
ncbi:MULTISPECIES: GNAT family N-acetyltransferase [Haloarcula]|uniref:GNAT family N-acetyltransferase n=1 Tax=Haloarcula TaxID=2237 RepID=UPI0023EE09FB|nr:GNAT family N-acetyltransferase [Halomicroarcula sp. XH51]